MSLPDRSREIGSCVLLALGVLSPVGVFPITRSCIPLAVWTFCISISCVVLLVVMRLRRCPGWSEVWLEGSPKIEQWRKIHRAVALAAVFFLVLSLGFSPIWHRGAVNWQMAISPLGYTLLIWSGLIRSYAEARRPDRPVRRGSRFEAMAPLRSEHWGASRQV